MSMQHSSTIHPIVHCDYRSHVISVVTHSKLINNQSTNTDNMANNSLECFESTVNVNDDSTESDDEIRSILFGEGYDSIKDKFVVFGEGSVVNFDVL
ncbi:hypothetical protein QTN25_000694 [Entamoeba marina]